MCNNPLLYYDKLRRKFNGAKYSTDDIDVLLRQDMVEKRSMRSEASAEAMVECIEVRMLE